MKTNILATADAVPDRYLLAHLEMLAVRERESLVDVVAHLATLDRRPALYAARGFGSLFSYCTQALRLSEDAACNRIDAARACRRFPVILDLLSSGEVTLTAVRLLGGTSQLGITRRCSTGPRDEAARRSKPWWHHRTGHPREALPPPGPSPPRDPPR